MCLACTNGDPAPNKVAASEALLLHFHAKFRTIHTGVSQFTLVPRPHFLARGFRQCNKFAPSIESVAGRVALPRDRWGFFVLFVSFVVKRGYGPS